MQDNKSAQSDAYALYTHGHVIVLVQLAYIVRCGTVGCKDHTSDEGAQIER